jgi:hypothetical protein
VNDKPIRSSDSAEAGRLLSLAQSLLAPTGPLQSMGRSPVPEAADSSAGIDRDRLKEAVAQHIVSNVQSVGGSVQVTAASVAEDVVSHLESALAKAANNEPASKLTGQEFASLEAVIEVTGRPAMRYDDGRVRMPPTDLGDNEKWRVLVAVARSKINKTSASVGRISIAGLAGLPLPIGTGWCCEGGLIVTNRHVVLEMIEDRTAAPSEWVIDQSRTPVIEFNATDNSRSSSVFRIASVAWTAPDEEFDVAFLRVMSGQAPLPLPLTLEWEAAALGDTLPGTGGGAPTFRGSEVYVVGHPNHFRPSELIQSVFESADGRKRWSPGRITQLKPETFRFEHDCSTLGGNSGSCVLTTSLHRVVGIHYGGLNVDEDTGKGSANVALPLSQLEASPIAKILRTGQFSDSNP